MQESLLKSSGIRITADKKTLSFPECLIAQIQLKVRTSTQEDEKGIQAIEP